MPSPWADLQDRRLGCLTSDQDWAPEWALEELLEFARSLEVPLHVFRTSSSPTLDRAAASGVITQGWHPNFRSTSSHGQTPIEVVRTLTDIIGPSTDARTHEFVESSSAIAALAEAGVRFLSQVPTMCDPWIAPIRHATGVLYLPVFWEDDLWLGRHQSLSPATKDREIRSPGLKILNIHAVHVGLNTPEMGYYETNRSAFFDPTITGPHLRHHGRGMRQVAVELVEAMRAGNAEIGSFRSLCDEVDAAWATWLRS